MLKLSYTDYGPFLEKIAGPLDAVTTRRAMLAMRIGQTFHIEPSRATFLLPMDVLDMTHLKSILATVTPDTINVTTADSECVEISLKGTWMANNSHAEAGTFITSLAPELERLIYQLWQMAQPQTAYFR